MSSSQWDEPAWAKNIGKKSIQAIVDHVDEGEYRQVPTSTMLCTNDHFLDRIATAASTSINLLYHGSLAKQKRAYLWRARFDAFRRSTLNHQDLREPSDVETVDRFLVAIVSKMGRDDQIPTKRYLRQGLQYVETHLIWRYNFVFNRQDRLRVQARFA